MFDLNQILSAALNAAVAEAIKPLVERIAVLERRIDTLSSQHVAMGERLAALENNPVIDEAKMVEAMNNAEWLWEKVNAYIETGIEDRIERAIDDHCSNYDHDDYDRHISDDDKHFEGDFDDAVREAVGNLSFEVSVS